MSDPVESTTAGSADAIPEVVDDAAAAFTYGSYLRIGELLSLQQPASRPAEHDEMLFIIIHQVYELWFKEVLHELDELVDYFNEGRPALSSHQLHRVRTILKTMVTQVDILETMTPLEFDSFRNFLQNSSGFQSAQFRELEYLLGQKNPAHMERFGEGTWERANLERRYREPSLWDRFVHYLDREPRYEIPEAFLTRDVTRSVEPDEDVQKVLVEVYRHNPALAMLCEAMIDVDEGLQEWRYRHVMMVQRTIGAKMGTGGSAGVDYLRSTLFEPVFPDLWAVRTAF